MLKYPIRTLACWLFVAVQPLFSASPDAAPIDRFDIQLSAPQALTQSAKPGAIRLQLGTFWIEAGGCTSTPERAIPWQCSASDRAVSIELNATGNRPPVASQLPAPVAWAATAVEGDALWVLGGVRADGPSAAVCRWTFDGTSWQSEAFPPLPSARVAATAIVWEGHLYLIGGQTSHPDAALILRRPLNEPQSGWQSVDISPANLPSQWLQAQAIPRRDEKAVDNALLIFGGWQFDSTAALGYEPILTTLKLSPNGQVTQMADSPNDLLIYASTPLGPSHVLAATLAPSAFAGVPDPANAAAHSQFMRFHLFTNTWAPFSNALDRTVLALSESAPKRLQLLLASDGEVQLYSADIRATERHFTWIDYTVMALYMLGLVAIGRYFAMRERSTEDFFLGGRKVPWWAAGLSIYATGTSAISFMAIPAKTYATDWLYFIGMSLFPFVTMVIAAYVFIPMLRKLEITTVMEYFEMRFGRSVRLLISAISVLSQVAGRMSITLLLPSIALTAVTGMNIYACILTMGILATIYTAVGGINAVIWTDVLQVFVLFGGAILSIILIVLKVDGGVDTVISLATAHDKFNFLDLRWDFTMATLWVMCLWAIADVFGKALGQEGLQRAFSTKGVKEARRSMLTCAVVALPAGFLFYGIGTALYAFYHSHPEQLNPMLQTDAIFPLFIAQQLPVGIAGLVISGLFAASMSTLDTAMNTSATILVRDFYSIWRKDAIDGEKLRIAKWITITCGVFGTGTALYMASFDNLGSLWDMFGLLLGVIGGGLGGVGFLALCTTRATTRGTLAGAAITAVCMVLIQRFTPLHFFAYGTVSLVIGSSTGYLLSLLLRERKPKDLRGLTLWTLSR